MCTQSVLELVSVAANEMPMDTTNVYVEATETREIFFSDVLKIENLVSNTFLLSNGCIAKSPSSLVLNDRNKDILYGKFVCNLDAETLDEIISQLPGAFHFCLKLPLSPYNPMTRVVTEISSPMKSNITTVPTPTLVAVS